MSANDRKATDAVDRLRAALHLLAEVDVGPPLRRRIEVFLRGAREGRGQQIGGHFYPLVHLTSDCSYGCGAWMGPSRSGGGDRSERNIDPHGACPMNPPPAAAQATEAPSDRCTYHPERACIALARRNGLCAFGCAIDNGHGDTPAPERVP